MERVVRWLSFTIASAVASGVGGLFVRTLLEDVQNYGSLAERTLRKIVDSWSDAATFSQLIQQLEQEMGEDYLEPMRTGLPEGEVVIAIEHQTEENGEDDST